MLYLCTDLINTYFLTINYSNKLCNPLTLNTLESPSQAWTSPFLSCYAIEEVADQKVKTAFLRCGQTKIELLEPTSPESTIAKFIENNNGRGGMHHIAFAVENIEGHLEEAKELGIRLIDQAPRGGAEGLSIAFLHPKSTFGVLTELCENKNK